MKRDKIFEDLKTKYDAIGQDVNTHLSGLLHSKPITYWDYIQPEALLNLQVQRTNLPDEMVFIMYHQINELLFKMISAKPCDTIPNPTYTTFTICDYLIHVYRAKLYIHSV